MKRLGFATSTGDHRDDRQVERLGDRLQITGTITTNCTIERRSSRRVSLPRPPARPKGPLERTIRGRPKEASARHRDGARAGRSPGLPPRSLSDKRGCGNAGHASDAASAQPASPATRSKVRDLSPESPGPDAENLCSTPRGFTELGTTALLQGRQGRTRKIPLNASRHHRAGSCQRSSNPVLDSPQSTAPLSAESTSRLHALHPFG